MEVELPQKPSPSDKVSVTRTPPLPTTCAICLAPADGEREFIDFNQSLDYYGAVLICRECITPVAHSLDFVEVEKLNRANSIIETLRNTLAKTQADLYDARTLVNSLSLLRPDLVSPDSVSNENSESEGEGDNGDSESEGLFDSGLVEQNSSRGPESLFKPKSDDGLEF